MVVAAYSVPPTIGTGCDSATLVDPNEVRSRICSSVATVPDVERLPIANTRGRVLAENIRSRNALPRFDNAAMDGFAIHADDLNTKGSVRFQVICGVRPGDRVTGFIRPGVAVPVTTGAPIPPGTGAVIAVERATSLDRNAIAIPQMPVFGTNIRRVAEDTSVDELIVRAGATIDARHIAFMAAAGVTRVSVRRKLRVCVMSTGNELVDIGSEPAVHQIVDANRPSLAALLDGSAIEQTDIGIVRDDPATLRAAFTGASSCDLVVISGGVSGSDTDYVAAAVTASGGQVRIFKLALKPGKPFLFGTVGTACVLGLPGNPVSAFVSFMLFGRPLVRALLGATGRPVPPLRGRAACKFPHHPGRTEFVPVLVEGLDDDGTALLRRLGAGGSANLSPLAAADGLAEIPSMAHDLLIDDPIMFHPFVTSLGL